MMTKSVTKTSTIKVRFTAPRPSPGARPHALRSPDHLGGLAPARCRCRRGGVEQPVVLLRVGGVDAQVVHRLAGPVVVARPGDDQTEVACDGTQPLPPVRPVVLVVD